jgi:tripartite-type tricarboxylate transporter receptor subunit TctC
MKVVRRKFLRLAAGAVALPAVLRRAIAQSYPTRPVRIVVGFTPGGATDILARLIGQWLSERLGQPFVVENRPGAGSNIATDAVVRSPADGYTLMLVAPANAINATLYDKLPFDFIRDIAPVAGLIRVANVMEVNPALPAKTLPEFIAYAKANPGKLNYASAGNGTTSHLCAELLKRMTAIALNHIPYRGSAPAANDVVAGQVDLMFDNATSIIAQVRAGTVKALGVTSLNRSPLLPDMPAIAETVAGYDTASWFGIGVRAGTPDDIVGTIEQGVRAVTQEPAVKERLATLIADPVVSDRKSFGDFVAVERRKWGALITDLKIRIE